MNDILSVAGTFTNALSAIGTLAIGFGTLRISRAAINLQEKGLKHPESAPRHSASKYLNETK
jgi:hypothetical protein